MYNCMLYGIGSPAHVEGSIYNVLEFVSPPLTKLMRGKIHTLMLVDI